MKCLCTKWKYCTLYLWLIKHKVLMAENINKLKWINDSPGLILQFHVEERLPPRQQRDLY